MEFGKKLNLNLILLINMHTGAAPAVEGDDGADDGGDDAAPAPAEGDDGADDGAVRIDGILKIKFLMNVV
jgi:hypothetical protein